MYIIYNIFSQTYKLSQIRLCIYAYKKGQKGKKKYHFC